MLVHPVIAESCATALEAPAAADSSDTDLPLSALRDVDLLQRFAEVSDGRKDQGRDDPVAVVLVLCAAAVLGGMRSFTAIAGWVADVPVALLDMLYRRGAAGPTAQDRQIASFPSKTTVWRVLTGADPAAVNAAIGAWLLTQADRTTVEHAVEHAVENTVENIAEHAEKPLGEPDTSPGAEGSSLVGVAVDGKAVRGAVGAGGEQTHLLAAATHGEQLVLGQIQVGVKSNEIPQFTPLISGLAAAGVDPSNIVITADALCRARHNASYEDVAVMPMCWPALLVVAATWTVRSALFRGCRGRP